MISSLKSEKKIELLFNKGSLIKKEGLLLKFYFFNDGVVKYGVSVPKKRFKSAVKRNLIKRKIRESVRGSNSFSLLPVGVSFFIIYNYNSVLESKKVSALVDSLLKKLVISFK
jgi:ribonuclease P protein component